MMETMEKYVLRSFGLSSTFNQDSSSNLKQDSSPSTAAMPYSGRSSPSNNCVKILRNESVLQAPKTQYAACFDILDKGGKYVNEDISVFIYSCYIFLIIKINIFENNFTFFNPNTCPKPKKPESLSLTDAQKSHLGK